ncbi:hypothetical protein N8D56_05120 [Devosia sp. A8/3-2]|nr:hypothetical protein N8D56_05120 [Devosia sp. A8/3-2]
MSNSPTRRITRRCRTKPAIPSVKDPSLALRIDIAALILVKGMMRGWFTGKKLGDYTAFTDMRRVVNGTDRAKQIAQYAEAFSAALPATTKPAQPVKPIPAPGPVIHQPINPDPDRGNSSGFPRAVLAVGIAVVLAVAVYFIFFHRG